MKISFRNESKINAFSDKEKPKEFVARRPALEEMLKAEGDGNLDLHKGIKSTRNDK